MSRALAIPTTHFRSAGLLVVWAVVIATALLFAASASASFEQVATFGELNRVSPYAYNGNGAAAVNISGDGGAPAGTVYLVGLANNSQSGKGTQLLSADGEPLDHWVGEGTEGAGVAVDQTTGDVYVLGQRSEGLDAISVYSADGSQLITRFAVTGTQKETFAESPEKIHRGFGSGIAVDGTGRVYVSDQSQANPSLESRVMVFEPETPDDYKHYVYAGGSHDIASSTLDDPAYYGPQQLAVDAVGDVYFTAREGAEIYEFSPDEPSVPRCSYTVPGGGAKGLAVNPATGEVYYYSDRHRGEVFHLNACDGAGKFTLLEAIKLTPELPSEAPFMPALTFNPTFAYGESRPAGVLYAVAEAGVGYIFAPAEVRDPVVVSESFDSVTASGASLQAQIDPKGSPTRYVFQYVSDSDWQANGPENRFADPIEAPVGGALVPGAVGTQSVLATVSGLAPDTVYHFRVVASSHCDPEEVERVCEGVGTEGTFRTFAAQSPGLPDERVWELVSPINKNGGEVFPADSAEGSCITACKPGYLAGRFALQSAADGEAVVYEGSGFSFGEGGGRYDEYISRRSAGGWQTVNLTPPLFSPTGGKYEGFDWELSRAVLSQPGSAVLSADSPSGYDDLYSQPTASPSSLTALVTSAPPNRSKSEFQPRFVGASTNFSALFFEANDALTDATAFAPAAVDGGASKDNLYELIGDRLTLVNVLPGNSESVPGAELGGGTQTGENHAEADFYHAISRDGSRVFWSDSSGQVFVREDGERTLEIPDRTGKFLAASADGAQVLLTDGMLYGLESGQMSDLAAGHGGFQGIVGTSEDLSYVYFIDTAVLASGQNEYGRSAEEGKDNLYAWIDGRIAYVTTLLGSDNAFEVTTNKGDWHDSPQARNAEASPSGRWIAFQSRASLTGYDNSCQRYNYTVNKYEMGKCEEVFVYDSATGRLVCASCNPTGERPLGRSRLEMIEGGTQLVASPQPRYMLDSGRLYFDSQDSISPFDTNNGMEDVYEWEPDSVGSCGRNEGCLSLISSGRGAVDSNLLAVDATGKNVFFTSRDQLISKDTDELFDVYDAREGGGITVQNEAVGHAQCQGEACQASPTAPLDTTPASFSFEGAGNIVEKSPTPAKKRKATVHRRKRRPRKHKRKSHGRASAQSRRARGREGVYHNRNGNRGGGR